MSRFSLENQVSIVTGAGTGIGRAIALALSELGAAVVLADLSIDSADSVETEIRNRGGVARAVRADVTIPSDVAQMVATTVEEFGKVDILINNAGGGPGSAPTLELSLDQWHKTLDLTLTSAFLCAQRAGLHMIEQGRGRIVNIASVYGIVGHDTSLYDRRDDGSPLESIAYSAAKGGLISLTRTLATYWAPYSINVNAVAPGMVKTERLSQQISGETWERLVRRTPLQRPATPDEIASAAVFLSSAAASFVTGQVLVVDGGWTAW